MMKVQLSCSLCTCQNAHVIKNKTGLWRWNSEQQLQIILPWHDLQMNQQLFFSQNFIFPVQIITLDFAFDDNIFLLFFQMKYILRNHVASSHWNHLGKMILTGTHNVLWNCAYHNYSVALFDWPTKAHIMYTLSTWQNAQVYQNKICMLCHCISPRSALTLLSTNFDKTSIHEK